MSEVSNVVVVSEDGNVINYDPNAEMITPDPTTVAAVLVLKNGSVRRVRGNGWQMFRDKAAAEKHGRTKFHDLPDPTGTISPEEPKKEKKNGGGGVGDVTVMDDENCYYVNGMIVCP